MAGTSQARHGVSVGESRGPESWEDTWVPCGSELDSEPTDWSLSRGQNGAKGIKNKQGGGKAGATALNPQHSASFQPAGGRVVHTTKGPRGPLTLEL